MAFGDVNIQNTQTTTVTPQSTPVATPVVPQAKPVVIDLELQKLLQALNLTIEQWQAMSPQEQANARTQYAQNQQQVASEQTGMGIPGLSVERTTDEVQAQQGVTSQVVADDNTADNKEKSTPSTTTETSEKRNNPSWLEWRIKSNENKREFLKQKLVENGKFENYTDEQIDELFDNYIEYKTKERLVKKEKDISDDAWKKLTAEEKLQMMDETWKAISDDKERQKAINKTISDYSLIVSAGITLEEYDNLSKMQKSILATKAIENQIESLEAKKTEGSFLANTGKDVSIAILKKQKAIQQNNVVKNAINEGKIHTTGKYADVFNKAMKYSGLENQSFADLEKQEKVRVFNAYFLSETDGIEDESNYETVALDMLGSMYEDETITPEDKVMLLVGIEKSSNLNIIEVLSDEKIMQKTSEYVAETNANGTEEDIQIVEEFTERISAESEQLSASEQKVFEPALRMLVIKGQEGLNARAMRSDEDAAIAKKHTRRRMQSGHKLLIKNSVETINASGIGIKKALIPTFAVIQDDLLRTDALNGAIKGEAAVDQTVLTEGFIQGAPNSKRSYDTVNNVIEKGTYHKDAQVDVAKMVTSKAKENLSEDDAKQVHKDTFDAAVVGFDAENHDDVYEIMMNSGFTDVQEYAANNIYKLDESVRDWAEEYTKSLDIESVTNAIQTEPPVTVEENNSQVDNSSSYAQSEIITTSEVYAVNNVIHEIKTTLTDELTGEIKLDLNKQEDRNKLVSFFEQHPLEMAKYIEKAPLKNKESLLIALCQSSKNAAISFVKQNPSFGLIILSSSQIELGVQRDVALVMLQKADKGSDVWKTASEFIGKFYKGETNVENHKSLMFKA